MSTYGLGGFWDLFKRDSEFKIMLVILATLWLYTSVLKYPFMVPSNYSDVGYLWIRDVYNGQHSMQIPYVQYELEYPHVIGLLLFVDQAISSYFPFIFDEWNTFVVVMSILEFPFVVGTLYNTYKLCTKLKLNTKRIYLYMLTAMSFVIYGFYNWDFIVAYFVTLSIWLYLDKKYDSSAITLTLSVLTKFIPGLMLFPMLAGLPDNKSRLRFFTISAGLWVVVNAPFALANFDMWIKLFTGYSGPNHQLQNTWISMVIQTAGLGDVVSGARPGQILSFAIIFYLIFRACVSRKTPLEKILLSWYAWYGAIYLFDPQMFIQLFPIVILTPNFKFIFYRIADMLNAFIILFYFIGGNHPELPWYIKDQLTPFGLINTAAALRQLIFLAGYFVCFNPNLQERLKQISATLVGPIQPTG